MRSYYSTDPLPLPEAKSRVVYKQHLVNDSFNLRDYDPELIDFTDAHKAEMQRKLYGRRKLQKGIDRLNLILDLVESKNEALSSEVNYADEKLPQWKSTMRDGF